MRKLSTLLAMATCLSFPMAVNAASVTPYGHVGFVNNTTYSFTAKTSGDLMAYYADRTNAHYINTLSLLVNGVDTGISGLNNHTSHIGDALNFGFVKAGDSLVFRLNVLTNGYKWYSDPKMNKDGINHVYSNAFAGSALVPAGTYVGFEDLFRGGDKNYHDENFVFNVSPVPVPGALWLFGPALAGLVGFGKRKQGQMLQA